MFDHIPEELRDLKRWVCFDIKDGKKLPFIPQSNQLASSGNPDTWRTFEQATKDIVDGKRQHLGLAIEEPYVFLDLDEAQPSIEEAFDTYKQRSVSGVGMHLIGRGTFKGAGIHPTAPAIGMFRSQRFCLFTGDVVDGQDEIKDLDNGTLQAIYDWASGGHTATTTDLVEEDEEREDDEVLTACDKRYSTFRALWSGEAGEDHSASDHALISMLADETKSNEQVRRLFKQSSLCRPHRANDKYVNHSLKKTRGKQEVYEEVMGEWNDIEDEPTAGKEFRDLGLRDKIDDLPDGLIKRIADWHWNQALYPLQECSIAVGIGTIATVAGRCFQTLTRSGLNPWIILLADTSWGKNAYSDGISGIFGRIDNAGHFGKTNFSRMVGAAAASGEGMEDRLLKSPRLFSYFPEFDKIFRNLTAPNPASHIDSLTKILLDMYGRSGEDSFLKKRFKAKGKEEDETPPVQAPCLMVGGETIPNKLYSHMSLENIETGFIQRFSLFEADFDSVSVKTNPNIGSPMPEELLDELLELFTHCEHMTAENKFETVPAEQEAHKMLFDYADTKRRESLTSSNEGVKQALNRAGFKVFKFSALFGVAANWRNPMITVEHVRWAIDMVDSSDEKLIRRFDSGDIGTGQVKQEAEVMKTLREVLRMGTKRRIAAGIDKRVAGLKMMVPQNWLKSRMVSAPAFVNDKRGAVTAFQQTMRTLEGDGKIFTRPAEGRGLGLVVGVNE